MRNDVFVHKPCTFHCSVCVLLRNDVFVHKPDTFHCSVCVSMHADAFVHKPYTFHCSVCVSMHADAFVHKPYSFHCLCVVHDNVSVRKPCTFHPHSHWPFVHVKEHEIKQTIRHYTANDSKGSMFSVYRKLK